MLNLKLPFFGLKESISRVEEDKKYLNVYTYNIDGNENEVPLKIKNTYIRKQKIIGIYWENVNKYLNISKSKYENILHKKNKKNPNKQIVKLLILLFSIIALVPLSTSFIIKSSILFTIGATAFVISLPFVTTSVYTLKQINIEDQDKSFKREYENLQQELKIYQESLIKTKENKEAKARKVPYVSHAKDLTKEMNRTKKPE